MLWRLDVTEIVPNRLVPEHIQLAKARPDYCDGGLPRTGNQGSFKVPRKRRVAIQKRQDSKRRPLPQYSSERVRLWLEHRNFGGDGQEHPLPVTREEDRPRKDLDRQKHNSSKREEVHLRPGGEHIRVDPELQLRAGIPRRKRGQVRRDREEHRGEIVRGRPQGNEPTNLGHLLRGCDFRWCTTDGTSRSTAASTSTPKISTTSSWSYPWTPPHSRSKSSSWTPTAKTPKERRRFSSARRPRTRTFSPERESWRQVSELDADVSSCRWPFSFQDNVQSTRGGREVRDRGLGELQGERREQGGQLQVHQERIHYGQRPGARGRGTTQRRRLWKRSLNLLVGDIRRSPWVESGRLGV